ncbi:hypothetical protein SRB17_07230 [Streptomyces sp. RB17]|uniref:extracellular solute-binding protein n=1 Tax=Streptomyces sp. RB17 TaxID=2585197 RepID=UPI0012974F45|nr:extracellular solute-binding protein [Streptomyces sp. RB17]MQY32766.1 hypothetical protein [Streptomyces sp. RB17]
MGQPGLNRRQLLTVVGGLAVAGSFGFAALGTGADALASTARTRVRYWNLFSGGDGYNMIAMLDAFRKAHPDIDVKDSTLQWGNPFYTKLAMAAACNRAPDLGVMHMGRVTGFAPGRLLDAWDVGLLAKYGVRRQDYNPTLWKRGVIDGKLYALPLDIHVQLCFYRKDVLKKAGLLGADDRIVPVTSTDDWFGVLKEAQKATKKGLQTLGIHANDQNFMWWFFVAFYTQLGGTWFDDARAEVTFDTGKATQVLEFLRKHVTDGYSSAGAADAEQFINGAPFTWEGATSVTGPYTDSTGKPMLDGGGDLFLASHGRCIGPGGESTFRTHGETWLAYHYYDATDDGTPKLGLNELGWKDDWPELR